VATEQVEMHQALEEAFDRLFSVFEGSRFERRSDLVVTLLPGIPIPQFNGAWVCEDSESAAAALPEASPRSRPPASGRGCRRGSGTIGSGRRRSHLA